MRVIMFYQIWIIFYEEIFIGCLIFLNSGFWMKMVIVNWIYEKFWPQGRKTTQYDNSLEDYLVSWIFSYLDLSQIFSGALKIIADFSLFIFVDWVIPHWQLKDEIEILNVNWDKYFFGLSFKVSKIIGTGISRLFSFFGEFLIR